MEKEKKKKVRISKYDIVKVKIHLDQHFVVFSRYLLANILCVIKISNKDAQKISSDLKKILVENNLLEIENAEFQKYVFEIMKKYNYDELYINRYKMMNQLYRKRFPLIILIAGTVSIGKSTIATKLSERMNISNVLQTAVISDIMGFIDEKYQSKPFYLSDDKNDNDSALIKRFENECKIIRKGANFDMQKAFKEGKALIIEGHHILPNDYIKKSSSGMINITTPEAENETNREKMIREEMNKIDQKGIVIPFLLTASEKDHMYLLRNTHHEGYKDEKELKVLYKKFKCIQDYLLTQSDNFVNVDFDLDNSTKCLEFMHDYILNIIREFYKEGSF